MLVSILLPAVQAAREAARSIQCKNNLKQLGLALQQYHDAHRLFPPGSLFNYSTSDTKGRMSYLVHLLPFMEQNNLHDEVGRVSGFDLVRVDNYKGPPLDQMLKAALCPSFLNPAPYGIDYYGIMGAKETSCPSPPSARYPVLSERPGGTDCLCGGYATTGVLYPNSRVKFRDVLDGTANTLAIGERAWNSGIHHEWWVGMGNGPGEIYATKNVQYPINKEACFRKGGLGNADINDISFGSLHPGGANFVFVDGHVSFVFSTIDLSTYLSMASKANGEITAAD